MSDFTRRRALEGLAHAGAGFAVSGTWPGALLRAAQARAQAPPPARPDGKAAPWKPRFFDAKEAAAMLTLVDLILPQTDTPGGRDARAHEPIDAVLAEGGAELQRPFRAGLAALRKQGELGKALQALSDRADALTTAVRIERHLDSRYAALPVLSFEGVSAAERAQLEFFVGLKAMTLMGFYTAGFADESLFHSDYDGCTHEEHR